MKKISVPLFALIILSSVVMSCRKENVENMLQPPNNEQSMANLKSYYKNATITGMSDAHSSDPMMLGADIPDWESTMFSAEKNVYITPVNTNAHKTNKNFTVYKYLVVNENNGKMNGFFYYAVADNLKSTKAISAQQLLNSISFVGEVATDARNPGYILVKSSLNKNELLYDVANKSSKGSGKYISLKKASETVPAETNEASSFAPYTDCTSSGGTVVTVDWYYQTYENGVLVYEEYLYSTRECSGGDGGGAGGGSTACYSESDALAVLNSVSLSNPNIVTYEYGLPINKMGRIREPKNSTWEYCQVAALGIPGFDSPRYSAKFTGVRFKYTIPSNDPWKWEAFDYSKTVQTAGRIPACFTITVSETVSEIVSGDSLRAIVVIDYTVNVSVSGGGVSGQVQRPYSQIVSKNIYAGA